MSSNTLLKKKNVEYNNYVIFREMIKSHGVKLGSALAGDMVTNDLLSEEVFNASDYVVMVGELSENTVYTYMYVHNGFTTELKQLLLAALPAVKQQTRSFVLTNYVLLPDSQQRMMSSLRAITSDDPAAYIRHRYVPVSAVCCNILKHDSLMPHTFKIINNKEDLLQLFKDLNLTMVNNEYVITLPIIKESDPLAIWFNANAGDVIVYGSTYRYCEA